MSSVLQADRCQLWKLCAFQLVFLTHVLPFGSSGILLTRAWGFILEYLIVALTAILDSATDIFTIQYIPVALPLPKCF